METPAHCPYATHIRKRITEGRYTPVTPESSRRRRRGLHREIWKNQQRHQPTFQEAWRAFNNTLKGTLN